MGIKCGRTLSELFTAQRRPRVRGGSVVVEPPETEKDLLWQAESIELPCQSTVHVSFSDVVEPPFSYVGRVIGRRRNVEDYLREVALVRPEERKLDHVAFDCSERGNANPPYLIRWHEGGSGSSTMWSASVARYEERKLDQVSFGG